MTTDKDLLTTYLTPGPNSAEAFRQLADRYTPLIYSTAKRQAPAHLAEDITQAVFLLLARHAHKIRSPELLPAWLLQTTRFCAANARRADQRRRHHEQKAAAMSPSTAPPPSEPAALEPHLDTALLSLAPADRTALLLRFYNNNSFPDIAQALNTTEDAAKKRVSRALEKLRKRFAKNHLTLAAPLLATLLAKNALALPPTLAATCTTAALTPTTASPTAVLLAKGATKLATGSIAKIAIASTTTALLLAGASATIIHQKLLVSAPAMTPAASGGAGRSLAPAILSSPSTRTIPHDPIPTIEVRDLATNTPLPDTSIEINASNTETLPPVTLPAVHGQPSTTGTITLPYPPNTNRIITITASNPGYVPVITTWKRPFPADPAPDHFTLKLEKAITIGGTVLDSQNHPLPNTTIFVHIAKNYTPDTTVTPFMHTTTDAHGQWNLNTIPESCNSISVGASHPSFLDDSGIVDFTPSLATDPPLDQILLNSLRNRSHTIVIDPGIPITGTITGPDGKPINALITIGAWNESQASAPDLRATDDGRFQFGARPNARIPLTIHAPGLATLTTAIDVAAAPMNLNLSLHAPQPITMHIVDNNNAPIPGAAIAISFWIDKAAHRYARNIRRTLITDAQGNATWPEAPETDVAANISAPGCLDRSEFPLIHNTLNTILLNPRPLIRVHAVNADTNQPLADFRAITGIADHRYHDHINWLNYFQYTNTAAPRPDGVRILTLSQQHDLLFVRASGDRFAPTDSPLLPLDGHDYEITLPLHQAEPLAGQLFDTDGLPLANTTVELTTDLIDIYGNHHDHADHDPAHFATTDKDGNFTFPPQADPYALLVVTDQGGAITKTKKFQPTRAITLAPWCSVTGTVLSHNAPAKAGIPIQAETISYYPTEPSVSPHYSTTTDAAGHFTLTHLFPGEYSLQVDPDFSQKARIEKRLKLRPGQSATLTLTLPENP